MLQAHRASSSPWPWSQGSDGVMMLSLVHTLCVLGWVLSGLLSGAQAEIFAPNSPFRELARGAFLHSWRAAVQSVPELANLKQDSLMLANRADADDCGKKLLCELARKERNGEEPMSWDEKLMLDYYEATQVDYSSDSLFFNIAVKVGKEQDRACDQVYPRCLISLPEMLKILHRQGISFEIPGQDRDCQVYFLWKKKSHRSVRNEVDNVEEVEEEATIEE